MNINATLVLQLIAFGFFWWFSKKYVWDPIMTALDARKTGIADSLAAAERGRQEQEQAKVKSEEFIVEAKQQASEIVANAEKRGSVVIEEARDAAKTEGERILAAANSEIEQVANRARDSLHKEVAALAVAGAGKIINREIDEAAHAGLIDDLIAELQAD